MRFTTKTEYGLNCLVYMARQASGEVVSIKDMAQREHFSTAYIEKILQKLRSSGIVISHQGQNGGYVLARRPSQITLKDIVEALEGQTFEVFCEPDVREQIVCTHFCLCGIRPVWAKTKELLDDFYGSITLEMMTKDEIEVRKILTAA